MGGIGRRGDRKGKGKGKGARLNSESAATKANVQEQTYKRKQDEQC